MELRPHPTPQHTHIASGFFTIWITKKVFYHLDSILLSPSCLSQFDVFHEVSYRSWATSLNGTFPNRADLDPLGSCPQMASPFLCPQLVSACSVFGPLTASGPLGDFPQGAAAPLPVCSRGLRVGLLGAPLFSRGPGPVGDQQKHGSSGLSLKSSHDPAFSCRTWLESSSMRLWHSFFLFAVLISSFP